MLVLVLISALFSLSSAPAPKNYLESLLMLRGTPYETLNCSQYISVAKRHAFCSASDFWNNQCHGDALLVQDVPRFEDIDQGQLQPGDVVAFHGVHVGAYAGNGAWLDSDFKHGGVGLMRRNHHPGGWFFGEVKVLRWQDLSWDPR